MAKVVWTGPALAQLEAIADVIAVDKPEAACAVVRRIFEKTDQLQKFKNLGRPIPEFQHPGYRQLWIKPCWIYYRTDRESVVILHVRRSEKLLDLGDLS